MTSRWETSSSTTCRPEIKFRIIEDRNATEVGFRESGGSSSAGACGDVRQRRGGEDTFATKTNWGDRVHDGHEPRLCAGNDAVSLSRLLDERESQRLRREAEKRAKEGPQRQQEDRQNMNNSSFGSAGSMFSNFR